MFAKIFTQIFDSSIAENWQTRLVFEDLLKLADINGVVDMTPEAIHRRTNVPLEMVKSGISELEKPDARSRNPDHGGARIVRLDDHRDWGWLIVNYGHYRGIASEEQRREKTVLRVQRHREKLKRSVTPGNAGNAMQRDMQTQTEMHDKGYKPSMEKECEEKPKSPAKIRLTARGKELAERFEAALGIEWVNDAGKWINRIKDAPNDCESVIGEVESAARENRIDTTPARFAEYFWKWLTKQPLDDNQKASLPA